MTYYKKYHKHYETKEHKQWRDAIRQRDKVCQECLKNGLIVEGIEAHHIKPISERPDLAFDISNGILLCKDCHNKKHDRCSKLQSFMDKRR